MFSERTLAFWQGRIEILTVAAARHRAHGEHFLVEQCEISVRVYTRMIERERKKSKGVTLGD
jgi:hypothetical protein